MRRPACRGSTLCARAAPPPATSLPSLLTSPRCPRAPTTPLRCEQVHWPRTSPGDCECCTHSDPERSRPRRDYTSRALSADACAHARMIPRLRQRAETVCGGVTDAETQKASGDPAATAGSDEARPTLSVRAARAPMYQAWSMHTPTGAVIA